jgi:hypothetical protein
LSAELATALSIGVAIIVIYLAAWLMTKRHD